ncbi:MAG: 3-ketoacyl-CoA thiolase [Candidatus Eisenbacteria bacterium]|uniref:3-ketoacyl-CoA thiolase n=1 Tax=Eiseniibacteriota bacterium TaxID=2212470 RepID=A0A948W6L5_UNCEI|nr:3-ketoacyl-CoA thiolase [Candidatus Eisenbacteria bacterium]MBU1950455.1 3-ketoacyl-CoA thiolase [Candidatus Eisenbacteria bacterium]MBU2690776.1 3-ketoacyl-CoA thiolase [Candidatus Eisenbacteria bacterium]
MPLSRKVYGAAGAYTISLGSGRKEFNPKKARPGLEHYIKEAGQAAIAQISDPAIIDECVIGNFMAARFNRQGNLAALMPTIHPSLEYKPSTRTEGACGSGGLAVMTGLKSIAAGLADVVLVLGTEVQNTVKAIYGADILAGAGHYASQRKEGHAYFFPSMFSDRAGAAFEKFGEEKVRRAMTQWFVNAVEGARRCPEAQEHHNTVEDLHALGNTKPNPRAFVDNLNVFDCSKVSDGAAAILLFSDEGLRKAGIAKKDAMEITGLGCSVADLTKPPVDPTKATTSETAVQKAYKMAGITAKDLGFAEVHDCFTITGVLMAEATGFVGYGEGYDFISEGHTKLGGRFPLNLSGGLVGYGHYTGGTGVRQTVDNWKQLTGRAGDFQVKNLEGKHGLVISMGGNDRTVVSLVTRRAQ